MQSKRCVVAALSGLVARRQGALIFAALGTTALSGAMVASAAAPSRSGFDRSPGSVAHSSSTRQRRHPLLQDFRVGRGNTALGFRANL